MFSITISTKPGSDIWNSTVALVVLPCLKALLIAFMMIPFAQMRDVLSAIMKPAAALLRSIFNATTFIAAEWESSIVSAVSYLID